MQESMARLEGGFDQMNERMKHLEEDVVGVRNEMAQLRGEMAQLRGEIGQLRGELERNFRWTVGILLSTLVPMWVTIILAVLLKG